MTGFGTRVRHSLGRLEIPASEAYRRFFIDLDDLAAQLAQLVVGPRRILEVGCGDGALARRLVEVYPDATYLGIDPAATAGRLYRARTEGVEFRSVTIEAVVERDVFDLVVIADVLHHIPAHARAMVVAEAGARVAPGGVIAIKEWSTDRRVAGRLAYWADFYVTGDKDVDFMSTTGLKGLIAEALPTFRVKAASHVRPWRENVLLLLSA